MRNQLWIVLVGLLGLLFGPSAGWAGGIETDGQIVSTLPPGTPPFDVSSGTRVDDLNADLLDGLDAESFAPTAARLLVVSPSGGHFASIQAALDSITDAAAENRYLVFVGPGVYTEQVILKPFVDVRGSGEGVTTIRWTGDFTVRGADDASLRALTVENLDDATQGGRAISSYETSPRLSHVTAVAVSSAVGATAISNESSEDALSSPVLRHVTASATGPSPTAIANLDGEPDLFDVRATAVGDDARGITNTGDARLVRVVASATAETVGTGHAVGIFNSGSSPELTDVEARASGGERSSAVLNQNTSGEVIMTRVRAVADADGGTYAYGVRNVGSTVEIRHGTLRAEGSTNSNYALYNDASSAEIFGSRLRATGSGVNYAVDNLNTTGAKESWFVELHSCQLYATTRTVHSHEDFSVFVGASNVAGSDMDGGGTFICAGVYDGTFTFYASTCPLAGP